MPIALVVALPAGCADISRAEGPPALAPAPVRAAAAETRALAPDALAYEEGERRRHDGEPYRLHRFRFAVERVRIEIVDMGMGRELDRVLSERVRAALVINGGYYGTDARPEGLVIADGREISPLLARIGGGVVALRGGRAEHHATQGLALPAGVEFAIQCSPRLVVDGAPAVDRAGVLTASRTALCIHDRGRGLDVYVADAAGIRDRGHAGPTLHTFARQLQAEGCEEALNLDGGPSTGFAWRAPEGVRTRLPRRGIRHALVFTIR